MPRPPRCVLLVVCAVAVFLSSHSEAVAVALTALADSGSPNPAVARIVVEEKDGTAYGSGTLIDTREEYALVITNWHVVRDASGKIEVLFPNGFRSEARALKLDSVWDLAALVIWRPPVEPAPLADRAPQPGDALTICGYGKGTYRAISGRCTDYYAPEVGLPHELVELNVEARQGDSGGPIFNDRGELAGVLFGAGQGTTLGSFGGRVENFLATLAPNIGRPAKSSDGMQPAEPAPMIAAKPAAQPTNRPWVHSVRQSIEQPQPSATPSQPEQLATSEPWPAVPQANASADRFEPWPTDSAATDFTANSNEKAATSDYVAALPAPPVESTEPSPAETVAVPPSYPEVPSLFSEAKSVLALVGLLFVFMMLVKLVT